MGRARNGSAGGANSAKMGRSSVTFLALLLLGGAICLMVGVQMYSSLHHAHQGSVAFDFGKMEDVGRSKADAMLRKLDRMGEELASLQARVEGREARQDGPAPARPAVQLAPAPPAPSPRPLGALPGDSKTGNRYRSDGRCGPKYPAPGAPSFGECRPDADSDQVGPCCNPTSGWCGNVRDVDWGHCDCPTCVDYSKGAARGAAQSAAQHGFTARSAVPSGPAPVFKALPLARSAAKGWSIRAAPARGDYCSAAAIPEASPDINVEKLYDSNPFSDPAGEKPGGWTQGWAVRYNEDEFTADRPLRVFIVPHSHTDPGWIKTVDNYYRQQTSHILTNMVKTLQSDPSLRFIYAETSFLSMWWKEQNEATRGLFRSLVKENRLEIVLGGWVMPDEANCDYWAMVDSLIEGHQWVEENIGVKPTNSWSIDPFGHSSTMAYLLKRSGFHNMLVQRIHYEMKRMLAESKSLEFRWQQMWDSQGTTAMNAHMMPFFSYDVPHTCGPQPKICCQFDFARSPGFKDHCPWGIAPVQISPSNVAQRAQVLLDQYKKKSQLYRTRNVLVPLGDDFRWDSTKEINMQLTNYRQLMKHMNGNPDMHVEVRWATLSDYFAAVKQDHGHKPDEGDTQLPTLGGDFFSYADREDKYWTGYFTSRPLHKHLGRLVEDRMRTADLLFTLSKAVPNMSASGRKSLLAKMTSARRELSLFQHHDAITGTAKDFVMKDYGLRLGKAYESLGLAASELVAVFLTGSDGSATVTPMVTKDSFTALPKPTIISLTGWTAASSHRIALFNSLSKRRQELVSLLVDSDAVKILDHDGNSIMYQVDLAWEGQQIAKNTYRVWFLANIPPLGLAVFTILSAASDIQFECSRVETRNYGPVVPPSSKFAVIDGQGGDPIRLEGAKFTLEMDPNSGLLTSHTSKATGVKTALKMEFVKYGTTAAREKSGAYLFVADGPGKKVAVSRPPIRITRGALVNTIDVFLEEVTQTIHVSKVAYDMDEKIDIINEVHIRKQGNVEFAMRLNTDITSGDTFHTDLNGFEMRRRKHRPKIPIGGNFYPMTSTGFLEDSSKRLSLNTRSPLGAASLSSGSFEVVLDRTLAQDDGRGLYQPLTDNVLTRLEFSLLLEAKAGAAAAGVANPSLLGLMASQLLNYPVSKYKYSGTALDKALHQPLKDALPCDTFLVNLRPLSSSADTGIIVHRRGFACGFSTPGPACPEPNGKLAVDMFRDLKVSKMTETTLTMMFDGEEGDRASSADISLSPMELYSFRSVLVPR